MTEYTHFDRSMPCASLGYAVGKKDAEVTVIDTNGRLYQAGSALAEAATGGMYAGASPTVSAFSGRVSGGTFSCSRHASVDTGLTTVYAAAVNIIGRIISGKTATLDKIATPDSAPVGKLGHATHIQYRIKSGNYLQVFTYRHPYEGGTTDGATKRCLISWIALGT